MLTKSNRKLSSVLNKGMYFDEKEVDNFRQVYNEEHPHQQPIPKDTPEKTWRSLQERLQQSCRSGRSECIISHLLSRPKGPSSWKVNPEEWITSDEIDGLEKRFEKVFPEYKHVGTFPIDFDKHTRSGECLVSTLCSLDIKALYSKGYRKLGLIFNTDVSTGPGQHWIATFCDISPDLEYPRMTYFDSYAHKPEKQIQVLMRRWKKQWDATGIHSKPMKLSYNGTRHQYEDSECGMYSIYFHYCCLMGIPMNQRIPDEVVRGLRGLLFRVK
jgi:hypothetical protein